MLADLEPEPETDISSLPDRLDLLTAKQRFVVRAVEGLDMEGDGHSFQEIAELMGISKVAVYQTYTRALRTMGTMGGLTTC